ncbi:MAG: hypothetical protein ACRER5_16285 [Pseudomonas sp.]
MFNNAVINELAAFWFWTNVQQQGRIATLASLEHLNGESLLDDAFILKFVQSIGAELRPQDLPELKAAVISEIISHPHDDHNILGPVYADEITHCRAPSAVCVETQHLLRTLKVNRAGQWTKAGKLLLRTPLPSAVICSEPVSGLIEVEDTEEALGFHYPLFLAVDAWVELTPNTSIGFGIFNTPVESEDHGSQWSQVLTNSVNFIKKLDVGSAVITVGPHTPDTSMMWR